MKKSKIVESKEATFYIKGRGIPKGCEYCLQGAKTVFFINGICQKPDNCCWYCPLSEERKGKEFSYANEIKISNVNDLLDEINKTSAKGMSITGGEPFLERNLEKTIEVVEKVKLKKGKKFHVHLYTNGINFNNSIASKLSLAGLDEIRFHPPIRNWESVKFAIGKGMAVGAEVPVIPDNEHITKLKEFILYLNDIGAEFINLNEFEFSFCNSEALKARGFKLKEASMASVERSREFALEILRDLASEVSMKMHFCTTRAKDYYQLKNRYLRRAKNIRLPLEEITEEGLLLYGEIEANKTLLEQLFDFLTFNLKIPPRLIDFQEKKINLPYYVALMDEVIKFLDINNLECYVIEALPFRREIYRHITEKTPIKVFKDELDIDENKKSKI